MTRLVIEGCAIATVDGDRTEHADGHIVVRHGFIDEVGAGPAPASDEDEVRIDGRGMLATPGLVNCHHHLYQWATRGLAQDNTLFEWLQTLYPIWAHVDAAIEQAAARAGLVALARSGCTTAPTTTTSSRATRATCWRSRSRRRARSACASTRAAARWTSAASAGGLPPDEVVEDRDAILAACEAAIDEHHDTSPDAMVRIALAPCSPFSVTQELMRESAELARARGVRLHTHMAETEDEERFCIELFGCRPVEYLERLGWLGDDVWLAHCVHLTSTRCAASARRARASRTARAPTRGSARGSRPSARCSAAARRSGSGSTAPPPTRPASSAASCARRCSPRGWPTARAGSTSARRSSSGTIHGARCLGREAEIGSLEPGKNADVALWRLDGVDHAGIADPVAALVLGPRPLVDTLLVGGRVVVSGGEVRTFDEGVAARDLKAQSLRLAHRAGAIA